MSNQMGGVCGDHSRGVTVDRCAIKTWVASVKQWSGFGVVGGEENAVVDLREQSHDARVHLHVVPQCPPLLLPARPISQFDAALRIGVSRVFFDQWRWWSEVGRPHLEFSLPVAPMTYGPGGELVEHSRAANFVRRFDEGPYAGRYIYWFRNHGGTGYQGRNPAYLLGGIETGGPDGKLIHRGRPVAVLYAKDLKARVGYPDFIWDDGLYITETQKSIARVHGIPDGLPRSLWTEEKASSSVCQGVPSDAAWRRR